MADTRGIQLNDQMTQASGMTLKTSGAKWDQKWRRAKPSISMLVDGLPGRVHEFTSSGTQSSRRSRKKSSQPTSDCHP